MTDEKAPTAEWPVFTAEWLGQEWVKQATSNYVGAWHGMASAINARLAAEGFSLGTPPATIASALEAAAQIAERRGQKKTAQENRAMKSEETPMTKTFWTGFEVFQEVYPGKNHLWAKQPENVKEQWELAAILRMAIGQAKPARNELYGDGYIAGLEDMREQIKAFIDRHWRFDEPHGPHTANDHLKVLAQEFGIAVPKDGDGR